MYTILIQTLLCLILANAATIHEYLENRTRIIEEEANYSLGGTLKLSEEELRFNYILMQLKQQEEMSYFHSPGNYNFSKHYFIYQDYIKNSKVFQLIKKMPKGAALHTHATFLMNADYLLNLTYEEHLYVCSTEEFVLFYFAEHTPTRPCAVEWMLLSELRNISGDVATFDAQLKKHFTLVCLNEFEECPTDSNDIWKKFDQTHRATKSLLTYRPVREKYIYDCLKRFYDDNVMYVEMRTGLHVLYELDGAQHDALYTIKLYRKVTEQFIKDHPDFIGIKLIISKHRSAPLSYIKNALETAKTIKHNLPEMIAGFDLVGHEDNGKYLAEFLPLLLESKGEIDYYFHAGETDWFGGPDENLVDAILLGTKRIGHGNALMKHPVLMDMVKQKGIAVEVNVISNAVLDLTDDFREHPLAAFISQNIPVVLSSDDPGVWGADPLSHDFYVAFMAVANKNSDLKLLKQLAINSIRYSALSNSRKVQLMKVFVKRWNQFIQYVLDTQFQIERNSTSQDIIS